MKKTSDLSPIELRAQLHDGVCQTLTAIHLHASVFSKKLQRTCPDAVQDFHELEGLITKARAELHQVVKE